MRRYQLRVSLKDSARRVWLTHPPLLYLKQRAKEPQTPDHHDDDDARPNVQRISDPLLHLSSYAFHAFMHSLFMLSTTFEPISSESSLFHISPMHPTQCSSVQEPYPSYPSYPSFAWAEGGGKGAGITKSINLHLASITPGFLILPPGSGPLNIGALP